MMEPDAHTLLARHRASSSRNGDTSAMPGPGPERSTREPRSKAGLLAFLFVLALVGWMGSGYLGGSDPQPIAETPREKAVEPFTVEAFRSTARAITQFVSSEGQAMPDRQTPVRAKTGGTIEEIVARKGQFLDEGDVIARIALADRTAQVAQAEAELSRRQGEFDRIQGLAERGYSTRAELESAEAELAVARAGLASIRQTQGDVEIRAPISGVLENFDLDLGEFIEASAEVGTQIDNDPLTVEVQVAQQNIGRVKLGQSAEVNFITGASREGEVTYVATNANTATRTFPVEITIPNPERDIPAGISAEVRIPVGETPAHFLSAAILALGPNGELGVKAVDETSHVKFYPAQLVRAETDGIWVNGLPDEIRIISVGQGFVSDGEAVRAVAPKAGPAGDARPGDAPEPAEVPGLAGDPADGAEATEGAGRMIASSTPEAGAMDLDAITGLDPGDLAAELSTGGVPNRDAVRMAQQALNALGYEAGTPDGLVGQSTRDAIRAFQADKGLEATGDLSAAFAGALIQAIGAGGLRP
ncbi:efflux RND transporter periplasmic adaptor subunit [Fulvimarina sp. 2208YS6-2-32]|uniref:Efflux RND transporter periplasmic adaptor subunit n=1 Tax=Fulvimarina uroteuthidis TaxID=3098149 RepID=A0ABU5I1G6_9HYPH|nr:efflux RND transporter periplasmic adaptor subunit [Fulvimarina sp. 2208YS6-2-32]MDY8108925.1 efflux RND transporter periplasmic adaptor subunit [Fulvimarina sp. 2208YS6-2-32]